MAQLLVRKIDESLKEQLRAQAKSKGRSLEEEARAILKGGVEAPVTAGSERGRATNFNRRWTNGGLTDEEFAEFEEAIASMRRAPVDPAKDLLVRNLEGPLKEHLNARARAHGRSVEEEARVILDRALSKADDDSENFGWASRFIAERGGSFTDEEADALELRGQQVRPATFE